MSVDIRVPELGESVTEATVGQWYKNPGDPVKADEAVAELETDKVTVEATAPSDGFLAEVLAQSGETVAVGAVLGRLSADGAGASAPAPAASAAAPAPSTGAANGGGASVEVKVPELGESVTEATVGQIYKKPGDAVAADEAILELETDKVTVEAVAPSAGVLQDLLVAQGATVSVGAVVAKLGAGAGAPAPAPAQPAAAPVPSAPAASGAQAGPAARRAADAAGVDLAQVPGTGKDGRPTKGDVMQAVKTIASQPALAARGPRETGPREERVRMSRLRQTIARRLKEAQDTAAMLTTFNEVDMTNVMAARKKYKDLFEKKHGVKLGFMSFFVKAVVQALKDVPDVNAEIDGEDVIYKNHYDIGVAVGTERGLVVPVLRDSDHKTMGEIEKEIGQLAVKARDGKLAMDDLQGGTFSITNGGVYGSLMSTPILNPPQSGILGMHKIMERAMIVDGEIKARPMMYLALSYDHRIVDGQGAVTFLVRVKEGIEDPDRLMLDL